MKTPILLTLLAGIAILPLSAQDNSSGDHPEGQRPPPPRPSRLALTLDADHDRIISTAEIANSASALAALDKDGDGQLAKDEFCGPKPRSKKTETDRKDQDKPSDHRPPPPDPLVGAIDADHDKIISATELADAPAALATLDKNTDGQLTRDEYTPRPKRPRHGSSDSNSGDTNPESGSKDNKGPGGPQGQRPSGPSGSDEGDDS